MTEGETPKKSLYADFDFEIEEVATNHLVVSYSDGSRAEIPLIDGDSREAIIERIGEFYHPPEGGFETEGHVPFVVGEKVASKKQIRAAEKQMNFDVGEPVFTYMDFRYQNYPEIQLQLLAAFEARHGDDSRQQQLDAEIESVNEMYPEDMPSMTKAEHLDYLSQFIDL